MRAVLIPVLVLVLVACGGSSPSADTDLVVAGFYPLAWVAEQVAGEDVDVRDLTPPGAEPHDLEITSDQIDLIQSAGTVILLGGGFQPALEEAAPDDAVLVLQELGIHGRVAEDDHGHEAEEEGAIDPHVWLDPLLMADVVGVIADAMGREAEAGPVRERLEALHERYEEGLADCDRDLVVSAHEAFGWLTDRYGLRHEALTGIAPEQEPDPRRLAELADLVRDEGVTTVFTEQLVSPRVAEALAREAGVTTATLDPLEGSGGGDYVSRMESNLETLREALGCR